MHDPRSAVASTESRIMLLDTASLYFRAYFGMPANLTAPDGTPTNAVRGLLDFITRLVRDYQPTQLAACWDDDWRPEFRVAAIPSYKAHRVAESPSPSGVTEEVPDDLAPQVPIIEDVLAAVGIARIGAPGFEADDVIATLAERADGPVRIVTGDRDLFQLVDDDRRIAVLYTAAKGVGRAELVDEAWLTARYDIPARLYGDFAALRGDPSDGLPGVKGIGERTAAKLVREYGDLAAIRAAAADPDSSMAAGVRTKINSSTEYLDLVPDVVLAVRTVPLPTDIDMSLPRVPRDESALAALATRWGLDTVVSRLTAVLAKVHG
ncbi:MAG: 5'-3' exonuclease [Actinobacteria bacterium]|nr:5'-3' exonuclease [Actinomycetota bacterium]MCB9413440.1 5'-3' exonuclease [Actinomycetota bacterium]